MLALVEWTASSELMVGRTAWALYLPKTGARVVSPPTGRTCPRAPPPQHTRTHYTAQGVGDKIYRYRRPLGPGRHGGTQLTTPTQYTTPQPLAEHVHVSLWTLGASRFNGQRCNFKFKIVQSANVNGAHGARANR
eukprot:scaffold17663_cov163-Isochrysis_galbana.AAC.1